MTYYGQFETPVDQFIHERYFPDGVFGVFVECGAFDGQTECSCKFFEETMGWTGFNLEPVPHLFQELQQNRPNATNLNVGLSTHAARLPFTRVVHPAFGDHTTLGSVALDPTYRAQLAADGCEFIETEINVIGWADFIAQQGINRVDLLVLDVEGHEAAVLEGMRGSSVLPDVMCVEVGHTGLPKVRGLAEALGYEYDVSSYVNAFFVRKDKLPLFALRAASMKPAPLPQDSGPSASELELQRVYASKSWRFIRGVRRIMPW